MTDALPAPLHADPPWLSPWCLAAVPLPAVVVGALVAHRTGISLLSFAPNLAASALGGIVIALVARCREARRDRLFAVLAVVATALMVRTLVHHGMAGVHRWIPLGPLRLHASMALAPWLAIAFAHASRAADVVQSRLVLSLLLTAQIVHLAQPDRQQAVTLAAGLAPLLLGDRTSPRLSRATWALVVGLAALVWRRPDPLAPLPHVEQIVGLALTQGSAWFALAAGSLILSVAPLAGVASEPGPRRGLALAATFWCCAQIGMTAFGAFPVPVLGAGAAGVLGLAAWLAALATPSSKVAPEPAAES